MTTDFDGEQRRDAMKNIGIGALLLTTAPNQIIDIVNKVYKNEVLHKQEAQAYWKEREEELDERSLPPGIRSCRDEAIKWAFQSYRKINDNDDDKEIFLARMGYIGHIMRYAHQIRNDTPFIEPAFWFMVEGAQIYKGLSEKYTSQLKEKNPALYYFRLGILDYFFKWTGNRENILGYDKYGYDKVADRFTTSIIVAANRPESDLKKYKSMNTIQKGKYLDGLMKRFNNMKVNPKARKVNDNYDKRLIAQWSALFLTANYRKDLYNAEGDLINHKIEKKLRKRDGKFRGPPYYIGENKRDNYII